jgi:poly-gamma-glutamate synthesis protein (capsule biosynthesis protein)
MRNEETIKIVATGDIMLGGTLNKVIQEKGSRLFESVIPYFSESDIVFGNLEAPFLSSGQPQENKIVLHQDACAVEALKRVGYNIFSIANNHIMDYRGDGLEETMKGLVKYGMQYVGAGSNEKDSRKPAEFYIRGVKIIFLGYASQTTDESNLLIYAQDRRSGIAPLDLGIIEEDIKQARSAGANIIILSLHWGDDKYHFPSLGQIKKAHTIIDMGADIILGHHSHILQGVERYKKGIIAYSLGNFIFGEFLLPGGQMERWLPRNRLTACIEFKVKKEMVIDYNIIPLWIGKELVPQILKGKEQKKAFLKIQQYSDVLKLSNYEKVWGQLVLKEKIHTVWERLRQKLLPKFTLHR